MSRSLSELTDILFDQIERLNAASGEEAVSIEERRAKAMGGLAKQINASARLTVDVVKLREEAQYKTTMDATAVMLGSGKHD